jgi:hypothetical protein
MFVGHFAVGFAAKPLAPRVLSHWVLDVATPRPDMQILPGIDTRVGLGLWNSRAATFVAEGALWVAAIVLYVRATQPNGRAGRYGFWPMMVILTAVWLVSLRGDPPTSLTALARTNTVFLAVVLAWAAWMNHARTVVAPHAATVNDISPSRRTP